MRISNSDDVWSLASDYLYCFVESLLVSRKVGKAIFINDTEEIKCDHFIVRKPEVGVIAHTLAIDP
jgi:hypothetical protein